MAQIKLSTEKLIDACNSFLDNYRWELNRITCGNETEQRDVDFFVRDNNEKINVVNKILSMSICADTTNYQYLILDGDEFSFLQNHL